MIETAFQKLVIAMLCDLAKPQKDRELDFDFIANTVVFSNDYWALDWKYDALNLGIDTPEEVKETVNIIMMWDVIERSFENLSASDQSVVSGASGVFSTKFPGFDGNNEEHYHIACRLVEDLDRFGRYSKRDLNSHHESLGGYRAMLREFAPIWKAKSGSGKYDLSAEEILKVLQAR